MPVIGVTPGPLAASLPCVQANLEVLLRWAGVKDVLRVLGAPCSIQARPPASPELAPVPLDGWINRCTGLELVRTSAADGAELLDRLAGSVRAGTPVLVYADAFTVAWNPYAGQEHHEHAFVVDGVDELGGADAGGAGGTGRIVAVHVVDAYTNATRYGRAEPGARWVPAAELLAALRPHGDRFELAQLAGTPVQPAGSEIADEIIELNVRAHARAAAAGTDAGALNRWAAAELAADRLGPDALASLSLASWLITRSRTLHAEWWQQLGDSAGRPGIEAVLQAAPPVVQRWQNVQTSCYLAWRRVAAGRPCPPTVPAALAEAASAESDWFAAMRTFAGWTEGGRR